MSLNESKGQMYEFITHTWNAIKGKCAHNCRYCYMKSFELGPVRLAEKEFGEFDKDMKTFGENKFIFVGSSTDMFAPNIPLDWQTRVLDFLRKYDNKYLFQTKNPTGIRKCEGHFPTDSLIGLTVETNRDYINISDALSCRTRIDRFRGLPYKKMISIEPVMDFDTEILVNWIKECEPEFVSVGADSKGHRLPEPSKQKVNNLIGELWTFTQVLEKKNLRRITG